jgi:hypothetical protein
MGRLLRREVLSFLSPAVSLFFPTPPPALPTPAPPIPALLPPPMFAHAQAHKQHLLPYLCLRTCAHTQTRSYKLVPHIHTHIHTVPPVRQAAVWRSGGAGESMPPPGFPFPFSLPPPSHRLSVPSLTHTHNLSPSPFLASSLQHYHPFFSLPLHLFLRGRCVALEMLSYFPSHSLSLLSRVPPSAPTSLSLIRITAVYPRLVDTDYSSSPRGWGWGVGGVKSGDAEKEALDACKRAKRKGGDMRGTERRGEGRRESIAEGERLGRG